MGDRSRHYSESRTVGQGGVVRLGVAVVRGRSMLPTLRDGDRLLVQYAAQVRPGDLVLTRLPDRPLAVKRAARLVPDGWWLERDNPREGVDSWLLGAVPAQDVLAVVRLRCWPRPRVYGGPLVRLLCRWRRQG